MLIAVYALCCPFTGVVRYIGRTKNPAQRLEQHIRPSARSHVARWCKALAAQHDAPILRILEWTDNPLERERDYIATYRALGASLLNLADGGAHITHRPPPNIASYRHLVSQQWRATMWELARGRRMVREEYKAGIDAAIASLRAVRRRIQRTGDAVWLDQFERNCYSHIVKRTILDYPVLPR